MTAIFAPGCKGTTILTRANPRTFCVVSLVAASSLGFELLQTKVLSALYLNNLVYMTVTIALMGLGLSGVLVSVLYRRLRKPERLAAFCCAGLAASIVLCLPAASSLPGIFPKGDPIYKMIVSYFILVIPFIFSGGALSLLFMCHGKSIFGLYSADLVASAFAAVLFSLALQPLGAPGFAWACSAGAFAAFLIQASTGGFRSGHVVSAAAVFAFCFLLLGDGVVRNQPEVYKAAGKFYHPKWTSENLEASIWTTIAKIDVWSDAKRDLWTGAWLGRAPNALLLSQDNDAVTSIHGKEAIAEYEALAKQGRPAKRITTLAYLMKPKPKDVLVIGTGGGVDVMAARVFGAENIDGAEINAVTVDLMNGPFAEYAQWPKWKNVTNYNAEGRRFAHLSDKKYDVIIMSGVDTLTALSSGAYVLSENYLYTVEAIRDYLNALKPDGMMVIYRWFFRYPRESVRLANLFLTAAETTGEGPADSRIMVIETRADGDYSRGADWAGTFIKRRPFTPEEVKIAAAKAQLEDYAWIYAPKVLGAGQGAFEAAQFKKHEKDLATARSAYAALAGAKGAEGRATFAEFYPFKIDPVYDDRPFFFEYHKGSQSDETDLTLTKQRGPIVHYVLYVLLALTGLFSLLGMGIPLAVFEREGARIPRGWDLAGFFCALGFGFMFVEVGCMQWLNLYLGHPMYSLMVVLASLLIYAGLGSLSAGNWEAPILRKLRAGMLGTACFVVAWLAAMKYVIPLTERWSLTGRITVVLVSLLPLGFCMGIPFATGLRYLADRHQRFIPWAWGINGLTSVAASILSVVLAMRIGFTAVVLLGAGVYAGGYFLFLRYLQPRKA